MAKFNTQLQQYLERALREVATQVLLQRGGAERSSTGGHLSLRGELKVLAGAQAEAKQEATSAHQEMKEELMVIATAQDLARNEMKQEMQQVAARVEALEAKLDTVLGLLNGR